MLLDICKIRVALLLAELNMNTGQPQARKAKVCKATAFVPSCLHPRFGKLAEALGLVRCHVGELDACLHICNFAREDVEIDLLKLFDFGCDGGTRGRKRLQRLQLAPHFEHSISVYLFQEGDCSASDGARSWKSMAGRASATRALQCAASAIRCRGTPLLSAHLAYTILAIYSTSSK
eukprot:3081815-Pleurochrysis_carterae.AAC.2